MNMDQNTMLGKQLVAAANAGDVDRCKELLEEGAAATFALPSGFSALHAAAFRGCVETCALLLARGADLRAQGSVNGKKLTPMQVAVMLDSASVVEYFVLKHDEDLNQSTADGRTLDALAREMGGALSQTAQLLVELRSKATACSVANTIDSVDAASEDSPEPRMPRSSLSL